ncbi:unnamed protein product [Bursaphelenchus xylophilus]|uniref:Wiskott-Aldrich syndrome protein family member n=1 Tax=Bursaphelenchus xylophilus TaxID=6326 RepID=A0A1I7S669_BURXY|nr:unnamed protein product [Bursaphelenchus xylophilus]CAG9081055.1 unnamed protein product [Bursaphelenchus xylophilus]
MPISLRVVEPVNVSLDRLGVERTRDELQCVANGTLANLVRQLSSLSQHGEQIFTDMHDEVAKVNQKLDEIAIRTARLNDKVHQNNGAVPQSGRLADNNLRKPYRSQNIIDQHTLSRQTMPRAMVELYDRCDPPPALDLFDEFRRDEKPALKYYTDPGYFFELWKQEILKECGIDRKIHKNRPQVQRPKRVEENKRVVHNARTLLNHYSDAQTLGYNQAHNLIQFPTEYQAPQINRQPIHQPPPCMVRPQLIRPTQPAPPLPDQFDDDPLPPPPMPSAHRPVDNIHQNLEEINQRMAQIPSGNGAGINADMPNIDDDELPPPPPMLSTIAATTMQYLPPQAAPTQAPPAPPPPPPPAMMESIVIQQSSFAVQLVSEPSQEVLANEEPDQSGQENSRSNLLDEIKAGYKLRKVERQEENEKAKAAVEANDVAAILRRRMEHVLGNEDSDENQESDGSEWDA